MPESQKQHHTPLTSFRCITMTTCPTHFYTNSGWAHSIQVLLPLYLYWGITPQYSLTLDLGQNLTLTFDLKMTMDTHRLHP